MNPFEYVNQINHGKNDIMVDDLAERSYNGFMTNRSLSYFLDTVMLANEMNVHHHLDNRLQFDFLINTVRKKRRFAKWAKPIEMNDLDVVKQYYGYSNEKAKAVLSLFNNEQLSELRDKVNKGGRTK